MEGKRGRSISPEDLGNLDDVLQLNGRDIHFVINVNYIGVTFDRRMMRTHQIETTIAKALSTYVRAYSLFKSGRLSTNIKTTLYKALITSVICILRLSHLGVCGGQSEPANKSIPRYWKS
jgi:hypothetical protein